MLIIMHPKIRTRERREKEKVVRMQREGKFSVKVNLVTAFAKAKKMIECKKKEHPQNSRDSIAYPRRITPAPASSKG
jgi:hypothetical protein